MKQVLRMSSAAVALVVGLASPALAQDSTEPVPTLAPPPPANSEDAVGPAQLRDFSINGTVTRRADTPATAAPATAQRGSAGAQPAARATTTNAAVVRPRQSTDNARLDQLNQATAPGSATAMNFPPPTPTSDQAPAFAPGTFQQPASSPLVDTSTSTEPDLVSHWPWLLSLLSAIGAALWYFRRQRPSGYAFAGAGGEASPFDLNPRPAPPVQPRAMPQPAPRAPAPQPVTAPAPRPQAQPAPSGIVSTRLRPWLEIEFNPTAAIVDAEKGAIQFEVTVFNSGSAPARDVLVEAALFNAGSEQDPAINEFFARPAAQGGDSVTVPPLQRMSFRSVVTLPREQLRIFEVEGRSLFVPLVGFNALYRWSSGSGQTSATFIVGRNTEGEKMAPFRVDQGAKTFRGLAAREHTLRVRN